MNRLQRSWGYFRLLPFITELPSFFRLGWRLFRDRRIPGYLKGLVILTLLYILSPFDVIPDFLFPGIGYLDDMTLLLVSAYYLVRRSPRGVVEEHVAAIGGSFQRKFQQWWSGVR